ncbi:MAG: hypothetical protein ACI4R5_00630 [Acetatifactor sp.]
MKRKKGMGLIEQFDAAARARGMSYAQAQVEETCRIYQKRAKIPGYYRKAGKRGS